MVLEEGKGLQKTIQISGVTHSSPRTGRTTPMKRRHPPLPPASGDSRRVEAERLTRGPQDSPVLSPFLAFLITLVNLY